jgi:hypothetical protein
MLRTAPFRLLPLLLLAAPAAAQTTEQVAAATALVDTLAPPAQAKAAINQQIKAIREGQMARAMLQGSPQYRAEAAKNQPAFNEGIARIGALQADALGPLMQETEAARRQATIEAHAKAFTLDELKAITAFFRSPVGTKLRTTQPQIAQQVNQSLEQKYGPRLKTTQQTLGPKVQAELRRILPPPPKPAAK